MKNLVDDGNAFHTAVGNDMVHSETLWGPASGAHSHRLVRAGGGLASSSVATDWSGAAAQWFSILPYAQHTHVCDPLGSAGDGCGSQRRPPIGLRVRCGARGLVRGGQWGEGVRGPGQGGET